MDNLKNPLPTEPEPSTPIPHSPSGGKVVACNLDEACVQVDCEEMAQVQDESPEAPDLLMHYCGVDYLKDKPKAGQEK